MIAELLSHLNGGKVSLALKVLFPATTFVGNFTMAELLTGNTGIAIGISACFTAMSTVLVAWIAHRPKLIAAVATADVSKSAQVQKETAEVFERMQALHLEATQFLQGRIVQQNKLLSLMTISKHAMLNECQRLTSHVDEMEWILRGHEIKFPEFRPTDLTKLTREEDRIRAEIVGITLPELP